MADEQKIAYGYSTNLFVSRKASSDSIVMGGTAEDSSRWTRVLSQRAAQMLWFHLTRFLFPEKSDMVTALVTTAPLRASDLPTITTHINVDQIESGGFELSGWVGEQSWLVRLNDQDARQFWMALDIALYPVGWQGSTPNKPTP